MENRLEVKEPSDKPPNPPVWAILVDLYLVPLIAAVFFVILNLAVVRSFFADEIPTEWLATLVKAALIFLAVYLVNLALQPWIDPGTVKGTRAIKGTENRYRTLPSLWPTTKPL